MSKYNKLFERKKPFYATNEKNWRKNLLAYGGGDNYIKKALVRHLSETTTEFTERQNRAYYFNYPRKIARLITQYVLATRPERQNADSDLVEDWSRTGLRTDEVMRQFSTYLNVFGVAYLCIDMPAFDTPKTKADELREKLRPYVVALNPLSVTDWHYGADGNLLWAIIKESVIDDSDPLRDVQKIEICRLWDREKVLTITRQEDGKETSSELYHNLGVVPIIRKVEVDGFGLDSNHWFDDVVKISDAILNNESEAQMNIIKQMFGVLVVSESFANQKINNEQEQSDDLSNIISRSSAIIEDEKEKGITRYISPNGVENSTIRSENQALCKAMFESIGLSTSKDSKMVESAEAKQWDFQNIEQLMRTRADMLEQTEYQAWEIMNKWSSAVKIPSISYCRNFSVLELKESITSLIELSSFNIDNVDYQKEIGKTATSLLNRIRQLAQDSEEKITNNIDNQSIINNHTQKQGEESED